MRVPPNAWLTLVPLLFCSVFALYRLSYLWYTMLGTLVTVVVGMVVSLFTTPQDPCSLHPDLLAPPVRTFLDLLPNNIKEMLNLPIQVRMAYYSQYFDHSPLRPC